ncbi:hypothetical protein [Bifidobacterium cebidarum]|uniref:Uncharacterized protein n=1 Tax=Bifidobacterium cebidarum TaxID=2650773 RepID=A0A6I1GGM0_9BIFI|nr:hypothetical protein [Bifidobacterium cebidarum]KAB7788816.1 hypothetical protein F7D08_0550 [Bifidobacterium cebidarum]
MAGYIFAMGEVQSVFDCIRKGIYSTYMSPKWNSTKYATFSDYMAMKPGDNVYFFAKRMVYGIGEIADFAENTTVINNFPSLLSNTIDADQTLLPSTLISKGNKVRQWIIRFIPSPYFYEKGIDMDALLQSDPDAFRSLRVFSRKSFIKFDDRENQAFRAALFRINTNAGSNGKPKIIESNPGTGLEQITNKLTNYKESFASRRTTVAPLLASRRLSNGSSKVEMLVEAGLLEQLTRSNPSAEKIFGHWDYLSHQVAASPLKPIQYMDFIDVFGYKWIPDIPDRVISQYLIVEIKSGTSSGLKNGGDVNQVMKYVDWVCDNYANGDYSQIKAFLVAHDFEKNSSQDSPQSIIRNYTISHRPARTEQWNDLTLVTYNVEKDGSLTFQKA